MISLGEATLDLIIPWVKSGLLPTFKSFLINGAYGPLQSQIPLITPQMWGIIFTGRTAGYHGLFDFWQRGPDGRFQEVNGSQIREKTIWQLLTEYGLKSGVINVPFTYPPQKINGFIISGEDAPGAHRSIAFPSDLYDEIIRKFGRYHHKDIFPGGRSKAAYLTLIEEEVSNQTDVLEYLLSEKEWDFFIAFYSATAIAQHYFWSDMQSGANDNPYKNVIRSAYTSMDNAIDRLIRAAGDDVVVFLISECGAGPLYSGVQVKTWLEREGFLKRKQNSTSNLVKTLPRDLLARFRKNVQGYLPKSTFFWLNHNMKSLKNWIQSYLSSSDIDWARTLAFSRGKEGNIYIHLKGREAQGIVNPGSEYESVRNQIIERLNELIDPEKGKNAVDRVFRSEELFEGPMLSNAPDLIIKWRDTAYQPTESDKEMDSVFVTRWREYMNWPTTGAHRINGILFARGPGICAGRNVTGARIIDLMPTWLYALNQKIPPSSEGRVISEIFSPYRL